LLTAKPLMKVLAHYNEEREEWEDKEVKECREDLEKSREMLQNTFHKQERDEKLAHAQNVELKQLPSHLKYVFLVENGGKLVSINNVFTVEEESRVIKEFDFEIKDKKGCENNVADHLSRLANEEVTNLEVEILAGFPDEKILAIQERPWFADIANFKAFEAMPEDVD